jgi:glycosyltransferase involved in cell wall biosynthesis
MAKVPSVHLRLYSPSPVCYDIHNDASSVVVQEGHCFNNKLLEQLWFELLLPVCIQQDGLDVLWGPAHRLPICITPHTPCVVTIHDLAWKFSPDTMRFAVRLSERFRIPVAVRRAAHIIVDSRKMADTLINELHIDEKKITIIPLSATQPDSIVPDSVPENLRIKKPYFLFVGTLEPRKNLVRLLTAYAQIEPSIRNKINLVIVGGKGWKGQRLKECISTLFPEDQIYLAGYVEDALLATLYKNAQFLAMPSLYEGFGLPVVEAMSYGLPVLTTENSIMSDVAENCGIFVDALDVSSIRYGLQKLILDKSLRKKLSDNALSDSLKFSWEESASRLISVFKKVVSSHKNVCL